MKKLLTLTAALALALTLGAGNAFADEDDFFGEVTLSNWVPNNGFDEVFGKRHLGDMWVLKCEDGHTVTATVDTRDDLDNAESSLDPVLGVKDEDGNLIAIADDNVVCTFPPVCGFACPSVIFVCEEDADVALIVRDAGGFSATGIP